MKKCPTCEMKFKGHPNKKYCSTKCKDRFHNILPARIERSKEYAPPIIKTIVVSESNLSKLLEDKINHPFAGMTKFGDKE